MGDGVILNPKPPRHSPPPAEAQRGEGEGTGVGVPGRTLDPLFPLPLSKRSEARGRGQGWGFRGGRWTRYSPSLCRSAARRGGGDRGGGSGADVGPGFVADGRLLFAETPIPNPSPYSSRTRSMGKGVLESSFHGLFPLPLPKRSEARGRGQGWGFRGWAPSARPEDCESRPSERPPSPTLPPTPRGLGAWGREF